MKFYYPENLEAPAMVLVWTRRNFFILAFSTVFAMLIASVGLLAPLVAVALFGIFTVQCDDITVIRYFVKIGSYLLTKQQRYFWEVKKTK
jgi:hypothetical protein